MSTAPDLVAPPFGSKRAAALALYKPPFVFQHGYIYDANHKMVADQDGFEGAVHEHVAARVRGWGRIGYLPDAAALQDEVGAVIADALTEFWNAASQAGASMVDAGEWQPIQTAPKDGNEFLAVWGHQGNVVQVVKWNRIHKFWQSKGEPIAGFATNATAWHPLPPPPGIPKGTAGPARGEPSDAQLAAMNKRELELQAIERGDPHPEDIEANLAAEGDYKESEAVSALIAEGWVWDGDQWVLPFTRAAEVAEDLAALVRHLTYTLRKADPSHPLPGKAAYFLKRHGLEGSPLRDALAVRDLAARKEN